MKTLNKILLFSLLIISFTACTNNSSTSSDEVTKHKITIFYSNDEHGWMEPNDYYDGAPGLSGVWKELEGYHKDSSLVLSGGDMWTGPAISTWMKGESMVDVMNTMGYSAAALGNHEFDFTVDELRKRVDEMKFPMLSANILEKSTGNVPDFVKPYEIIEINNIRVGIIGLSTLSTPTSSKPENVKDYKFTAYNEAINKYAPEVKEKGADVIIIIGHISGKDMRSLAPTAKLNGIHFIGGGHSHESILEIYNDVLLVQSSSGMRKYTKVELNYDSSTKKATFSSYKMKQNNMHIYDKVTLSVVKKWQTETAKTLAVKIGYCSPYLARSSIGLRNMVVDSWFHTFPNADVAISNSGALRQNINEGKITVESIVSLLPFDNEILKLELTGKQLKECVETYDLGGMNTIGGYYLMNSEKISDSKTYTVLVNDYIYSLPDAKFSEFDSTPEKTGVHYRQPVIDWIKSKNSNESNPINKYLDYRRRK